MTDNLDLVLINALIDYEASGANRGFQLGLLYIGTYVETKGFKCKVIADVGVVSETIRVIEGNSKLPLLGFYVTADNVQEVERACYSLKNLFPKIKIILGGPEARVDCERLLKNRGCDFVCVGDGEETTLQLLNYLNDKDSKKIYEIPNLAYLNGAEKLIKNPALNLPFNLDYYPIPLREMYSSRFLDAGHIITSRGCASECTFCFEGIDKKIRRHSVDRVIEEIRYLKGKFGTKYFTFVDDTFTTDRKKVYSLCEKIKENFDPPKDVTWYCEATVSDICKDPEIMETMVNSGLIRMQFGSESGNQAVLDAYKKEIQVEQIYKAVEIASKTNITSMFTNYIIGGAHETIDSYGQTLKLALDLLKLAPGVLECSHTFLSPYKGTDVRNNPDKYNIKILDSDFITSTSDSYVFAHSKHLEKNQLIEMGQEFQYLVLKTMHDLVPTLNLETMKRHFIYARFGLVTTWNSILSRDGLLKKWGSNITAGHHTECKNDQLSLMQIIPYRTFELENLSGDKLRWGAREKEFYFNKFELFLCELASGKLTVLEIANRVVSNFQFNIDRDQLIKDIINYYNGLANEQLITFRRFS